MIAYTGQQIVVHEHPGSSDYLLVTFNQLNDEHAADHYFFGQSQVRAADISCIGIATRDKNFYRSPEMAAAIDLVAKRRRGRPVVVFGQSMGGYAALKYSAALRADHVIAMSPFFSLDPDDLEFPSERFRKILTSSMAHYGVPDRPEFKGMGIRTEDVSGRVVVFYDPSELIDAYDARLIGRCAPQTEFVAVPHSGHIIYDSSWDFGGLERLFAAIRSGRPGAVGREFARIRRNHTPLIMKSLAKAAIRKPAMCARAIRSMRLRAHRDYRIFIAEPFNLRVCYNLASRGDVDGATRHVALMLREVFGIDLGTVPSLDGNPIAALPELQDCLLLTCHASVLAFDPGRGHVRFEPHVFGREDLLPVLVRTAGGRASFRVLRGGRLQPIAPFAALNALFPSVTGQDPALDAPETPVRLVALDGGHLGLHAGNSYLGATPTGEPQLMPDVTHQQRLVAIPVGSDSPLLRPVAENWFDRAMRTHALPASSAPPAPVAMPPPYEPPARRAPAWQRLFGRG